MDKLVLQFLFFHFVGELAQWTMLTVSESQDGHRNLKVFVETTGLLYQRAKLSLQLKAFCIVSYDHVFDDNYISLLHILFFEIVKLAVEIVNCWIVVITASDQRLIFTVPDKHICFPAHVFATASVFKLSKHF